MSYLTVSVMVLQWLASASSPDGLFMPHSETVFFKNTIVICGTNEHLKFVVQSSHNFEGQKILSFRNRVHRLRLGHRHTERVPFLLWMPLENYADFSGMPNAKACLHGCGDVDENGATCVNFSGTAARAGVYRFVTELVVVSENQPEVVVCNETWPSYVGVLPFGLSWPLKQGN